MSLQHRLFDALIHGLEVTVLVFVMMLTVDYLNVLTRGKVTALMRGGKGRQYLAASAFGATPGCLGTYLVVSLYVHGVIGFGGMVAAAVATVGDEMFLMLAMFPGKALGLMAVLFGVGLAAGALADFLAAKAGIKPCETCGEHVVHDHPQCRVLTRAELMGQLIRPDWRRVVLASVFAAATILSAFGVVGPHGWTGLKAVVAVVFAVGLVISLSVPDTYLKEHIWKHLMVRHLLVLAAWTVGTLSALAAADHFVDVRLWVESNRAWVLLTAVLVGLVPSSGPHMAFVALFAAGSLPFSALLANSTVQDGHGLLPLMAESVRDVLLIKGFKVVLGVLMGLALMSLGL